MFVLSAVNCERNSNSNGMTLLTGHPRLCPTREQGVDAATSAGRTNLNVVQFGFHFVARKSAPHFSQHA
jgi:hypothetical protein